MASAYAAPVSASQVGSYFVTQYYHVLREQPDYAHQFYTDASSVIHVDGESSVSASALLKIHALIISLNFTSIEIKTINSLESWNGGVLVVVSGSVKSKDFNGWRKFVQTFFLAPQEKGYFVLNDMLHFIGDEVIDQPPPPVVLENALDSQPSISDPVQDQAASEYALETEAREYVNSVHIEEDNAVEEYNYQEQQQEHESPALHQAAPEAEEEEAHLEESPAFDQTAPEAVQEPLPAVEEPAEEPKVFTYASILRAAKGKSAPSISTRPPSTKSTPPVSEWHQTPEPPAQLPKSSVPVVQNAISDVAEDGLMHEEGESKSVYVRNLPSTVTTLDILQEFQNFGRIKKDGVFLRNRKDIGICYAFVEFEDAQSVVNAVKASPIDLVGRQVYIEERRTNSSTVSRGGRRGRGRGGRFGGRGFGRGGYQDGSENNRVGSNGFRG